MVYVGSFDGSLYGLDAATGPACGAPQRGRGAGQPGSGPRRRVRGIRGRRPARVRRPDGNGAVEGSPRGRHVKRVGPWTLGERLGRGGNATVWEAARSGREGCV